MAASLLVPEDSVSSTTARQQQAARGNAAIVTSVKRLAVALAVVLAGCVDAGPAQKLAIPEDVQCEWARVRRITDGDTVRVDFEDGARNQPVRYIGIDTPELATPEAPAEPFAEQASERNEALVLGRRICLEPDVSATDRFGRLLRYAWLPDGTMVNEVLVRDGLAVVSTFPPDVKYVERLLDAQQDARSAARGAWAE